MRAVVLHESGGPEKLIAAPAASVNPIDWKVRSQVRKKDFRCHSLPFWATT